MKKIRAIWVSGWFNPCGLVELAPVVGSAWDMGELGIVITDSPKEADVLFIAGYQTPKSIKKAQSIFEQMPNSKVVVAVGSCATSAGMFWDSYNTVKKLTDYIPVNMYIPGCPPRPEAIFGCCEKYFNA